MSNTSIILIWSSTQYCITKQQGAIATTACCSNTPHCDRHEYLDF